MSKINYCSLEEAWGDNYKKKNENFNDDGNSNDFISRDKYTSLNDTSKKEREDIIKNMNLVERSNKEETNVNNKIDEYNKYRSNSLNQITSNDTKTEYVPFQESIEKKHLEDKLKYIEEQFKQYKFLVDKKNNSNNYIESFDNYNNNNSNDLFDIIVLIVIGFIIIFILNSIFNLGKRINNK
jgi:hypothetical protein